MKQFEYFWQKLDSGKPTNPPVLVGDIYDDYPSLMMKVPIIGTVDAESGRVVFDNQEPSEAGNPLWRMYEDGTLFGGEDDI